MRWGKGKKSSCGKQWEKSSYHPKPNFHCENETFFSGWCFLSKMSKFNSILYFIKNFLRSTRASEYSRGVKKINLIFIRVWIDEKFLLIKIVIYFLCVCVKPLKLLQRVLEEGVVAHKKLSRRRWSMAHLIDSQHILRPLQQIAFSTSFFHHFTALYSILLLRNNMVTW